MSAVDVADPIRSAGLLQSGRAASLRFSCFASAKRLFVISHTQPQPDGHDRPVWSSLVHRSALVAQISGAALSKQP